jgi:hypothetical protein
MDVHPLPLPVIEPQTSDDADQLRLVTPTASEPISTLYSGWKEPDGYAVYSSPNGSYQQRKKNAMCEIKGTLNANGKYLVCFICDIFKPEPLY